MAAIARSRVASVSLFLSALLLLSLFATPLPLADAARPASVAVSDRGPICVQCVCCSPPPPGQCCKSCCASPLEPPSAFNP